MREVYSVERVLEVNTEFQCVIGVHLRPLGFAILVVISPVGYVLATPNPTIGSWERLVALIRNTLSMIIKLSCDLGIEKRSEAGGVHGAAFVEIDYAESILLASAGVGCSKVEPLRVAIGVGVVFQDEVVIEVTHLVRLIQIGGFKEGVENKCVVGGALQLVKRLVRAHARLRASARQETSGVVLHTVIDEAALNVQGVPRRRHLFLFRNSALQQ